MQYGKTEAWIKDYWDIIWLEVILGSCNASVQENTDKRAADMQAYFRFMSKI